MNNKNQLVGPPYQYDAAGNLTADGSHTYTYDAENRLIQVDGGATAAYLYDAQGRRVQKSVGAAQTQYIYDLNRNVISELDQNLTWKNVYLRLNGELFAQYTIGSPRTQFVHTDHLGSTRLLTTMTQSLADSLDYLPFGEQVAGGSGSTHKFTGDERDSETSLDHPQFRQYTSSLARWISPDPAGLAAVDPTNPQSWNRYAYVKNNPLNRIDPSGLVDCIDGHIGCNCDQPDGGCSNDYYGAHNPGNGCSISDVTCGSTNSDKEIAQNIAAENPFSSTVANALFQAQGDYYQSVADDEARQAAKLPWEYIIVHCSGPGNNSWECWPLGPYAQLLAAGSSPYFSDDDARLRYLARGVVSGAGVIGDPRYIAGFYGASALLAAPGAIAADVARGPWESALFGRNGGFLNSLDELRVGFGWYDKIGQNVFRVTGDWLNGRHLLNWPWPW